MAVVATGVHDTDVLPLPGGASLGGEGNIDLLCNGQGIHVGAQSNDRTRATLALEHGHDARVGDTLPHIIAKLAQMLGHELCRATLLIAEFGMLMDITAPLDHAGF